MSLDCFIPSEDLWVPIDFSYASALGQTIQTTYAGFNYLDRERVCITFILNLVLKTGIHVSMGQMAFPLLIFYFFCPKFDETAISQLPHQVEQQLFH